MVLEWLRAVATLADDDTADRPPQAAVVAVAAVRVGYANYDGRACRPSQQTVAQAAGVKRQRVREVDRFLVARGFLKVVRPGSRTAPIEYRLVLPVDDLVVVEAVDNGPDDGPAGDHYRQDDGPDGGPAGDHHPPDGGPTWDHHPQDGGPDGGPAGDHYPQDGGPDDGPDGGPPGGHYLPPTTLTDSEAAASQVAEAADGPAAAAGVTTRDQAVDHLARHVEARRAGGYSFANVDGYTASQLAEVVAAIEAGENLEQRWPTGRAVMADTGDADDWLLAAAATYTPPPSPAPHGWVLEDGPDGAPVARPRRSA